MGTTGPVWADLHPRVGRRPPLAVTATADVAVVGLGASGLTAAWVLAEQGRTVVGVDAQHAGAGAAGANAGFLMRGGARFYDAAVAVWGADVARSLWDATAHELDVLRERFPGLVEETGRLRVAVDDDERAEIAAEADAMRAAGLDVEHYDGPAGEGLFVPGDAACDPLRRVHALAEAAEATGRVALFESTTAEEVGTGRVRCHRGEIHCDTVLVLADGALPRFAGARPGARATRLQMLATEPCPVLPSVPAPVYRRRGFDYARQLPDGRVVVGGCRDRHLADEWDAPDEPSDAVQHDLDALAASLGADAPVSHRWGATVAYRDDALPWLGAIDERVLAAGAYSGVGNLVGAACARTLAALVAGEVGVLDALVAR
jgi:glycine/D-amino acid oxidase-like deaminating enzyme